MGSRNLDGSIITQSTNVIRVHSQANTVKLRDTSTNLETSSVVSSGIDNTTPLGAIVRFAPADMTLVERNADHSIEYEKFIDSSGSLEHIVSRGMGIHTSISMRAVEASGTSLGPMNTKTERKVFFIDNDRNLAAANQGDWTIYDAGGNAVGEAAGTTDVDITPHDT